MLTEEAITSGKFLQEAKMGRKDLHTFNHGPYVGHRCYEPRKRLFQTIHFMDPCGLSNTFHWRSKSDVVEKDVTPVPYLRPLWIHNATSKQLSEVSATMGLVTNPRSS